MKPFASLMTPLLLILFISFPSTAGQMTAVPQDPEAVAITGNRVPALLVNDLVPSPSAELGLFFRFDAPAPAWSEEDPGPQLGLSPEPNQLIEAWRGGEFRAWT